MWKIMLVEDESLLRKALRKTISGNPDYDVCYEAVNGISALEYLQSHKVDIIVSDIRMPAMDGLELIKRIHDMDISVKIIVLSGYSDFEYARHMLKYHAFSYLLKPIVPEELMETLGLACEEIRQQEKKKSILKSHTFQNFQKEGYVHFTNELPCSLLHSSKLTACCMDFEGTPEKEDLMQWQFELERSLYPCCCFWLDSYLYLVIDSSSPDRDLTETIVEVQLYFENQNIAIRMGVGLNVSSMMEISSSISQARQALHHYHQLPLHEIVYYQRISLLEANAGSSSYPLTGEKNLLSAVISLDEADLHPYIVSIQKHLEPQGTELIYQNLTELIFACKRELSQYNFVAEWENLYYSVRARDPWELILERLEKILTDCHQSLLTTRDSSSASMIIKARQYICQHATEPLTLDEVASYCYLSKSHFCKLFKSETGETFKSYLNQIRIDLAKELLKTTGMKSYEVAEAIGFDDASYFNELFKKKWGMTPNKYRKTKISQ